MHKFYNPIQIILNRVIVFSPHFKKRIYKKISASITNKMSFKSGIYHIQGEKDSKKTTRLYSISGFKRGVKVKPFQYLQQTLSSVPCQNIRVIKHEPIEFNDLEPFNSQILGPELSKSLHWRTLLAIKTKYLFSNSLRKELLQVFNQIESRFSRGKHGCFSSGERILISCMRALASWDKDVSHLVVDECSAFLDYKDYKMRPLFLQCLNELSIRVSVLLLTPESIKSYRPVEVNLNCVN